jgi:predicted nucleic acid-binding protein
VLIYLLVASQPEHVRARDWIASADERLATTPVNIAEFLRLITHPRLFSHPLSLAGAVETLKGFVNDFGVTVLEEDREWWTTLPDLEASAPGLRGNEVFDARIALCLRYNGIRKICTLDGGFARFPFLERVSF